MLPVAAALSPPSLDQLDRTEFNFRAQERALPLFWRSDANGDRRLDPDELVVIFGPGALKRSHLVDDAGRFTAGFFDAYRALLAPLPTPADPSEQRRQALVVEELRKGRPTLVETELSRLELTDGERLMVRHVLSAAVLVEKLHGRQLGTDLVAARLPTSDTVSRALLHRNQEPHCVTPSLESNPACNALPGAPARRSGLYPLAIQDDPKFCDRLSKQPNAAQLMDHFSVVVADGAGFRAVPYHEAYREEMTAVASELEAAAGALTSPTEAPFRAYLEAAARAFRTNDWEPANEAWAQMGGSSSRWYLRIAPDEVYYEPCAWKAGFAVSFARINPDSKSWQARLEPVKGELEKELARLAGPPYKARNVGFKLPDFIDIVQNAGDSRAPHGATVGQSLPNWGPVAERGGRTVAMTNLYTDADSQSTLKGQMASLFCAATMARTTTDPAPSTMSTVLHEAAHNLGPAHDYAVGGKRDSEVFGGPLASTLEELKAQTSALYLSEWLVQRKVLTRAEADRAHIRDVAWAFGHIARGMYDGGGNPKPYSQLASIQLGTLHAAKALLFRATDKAASGEVGCFDVDLGKWAGAIEALEARVLRIKGRGDRADAEALKASFVDSKDEWAQLRGIIAERWLRAPKATFVYSVH
jgi:hypothetical protein